MPSKLICGTAPSGKQELECMTVLNKNSHLALFCSAYLKTYLFL